MTRIILFGGSFDPIHNGHFHMAKQALMQRKADALWFLPGALNPFKDKATPFEHRVAMIQSMITGNDRLSVCEIENTLPSPSYSIDTVRALQKMHPNVEFEWLMGSDQLPRMHEWKEFEELEKRVQFIVYARDTDIIKTSYPIVYGEVMPYSSTDIRNGVSTATSPHVLKYMMTNGLYLEVMNQHRLSDYRFNHVQRVVALAEEIGKAHNLNLNQIRLAAWMHDFCKEDDRDQQRNLIQTVFPKNINKPRAFYHGYAASHILSTHYYVRDKHVLRAIFNHVDGTATNPIAMVLYIADKCERGRDWDSEFYITLSKQDLRKGFKEVRKRQYNYEANKEIL